MKRKNVKKTSWKSNVTPKPSKVVTGRTSGVTTGWRDTKSKGWANSDKKRRPKGTF